MKTKVTVERASRQVIESKLLTSLTDSELVAILVGEEDLKILIEGLQCSHRSRAKLMAEDFLRLKEAAFPKST